MNCMGNGDCNKDTWTCECHEGYGGTACNVKLCPPGCTQHGYCKALEVVDEIIPSICVCQDGFAGDDCLTSTCIEDGDAVTYGG